MFPEEVRVSWRRRGGGGGGEEDREQLELRGPTYTGSILVIDQKETLTDQYICRVEHESGLQEISAGNQQLPPLTPLAITWNMVSITNPTGYHLEHGVYH